MKVVKYMVVLLLISSSFQASSQLGDFNKPKSIIGLNSPIRIANSYIIVLKKSAVDDSAFRAMKRGRLSFKEAKNNVISNMSTDLARQANGDAITLYNAGIYGFELYGTDESSVKDIVNDSRIQFIEVDQQVTSNTTQTNVTWGLDRIDQEDLPLNNTYVYEKNGTGVDAYIIDTGISTSHTNFGGRAQFGVDTTSNPDLMCSGHGTHVAGTVGSQTYGVAKNVNLISVRVLDCISPSVSDLVAGIDWVIDTRQQASPVPPAVANISLGTANVSVSFNSAVNALVDSGVTTVVAAGNSNADACGSSPASASKVISVGASTITDGRASFSNFGSCVDIFAPGKDITSTWTASNTSTNTISGTSMASPHVAGAVAQYLQAHPSSTPSEVLTALTDAASSNKLSNIGNNSPNKLLNAQNLFQPVSVPDQYDDIIIRGFTDDVPGDAVRLFAGASAQLHNFHDTGDQDWTIFAIPGGGSNIVSSTQLDTASARLAAYRVSPFPTETSPGRWDISLGDLILEDSDQSNANNSVTVLNNTASVQAYVIKSTSSGPSGVNTDYEIESTSNPASPDQYDDISIRGFNDDVPGDAVRIFAGASAQTHNFHDTGDQDWTIFAIPAGGSNTINTTQLGTASAKLAAYRISPFPTETSPGRWDISLSDLILVDSDQSTGNNSVTVQNNTAIIQGYVIKATSSGTSGHNTSYQIHSTSNPASPDQYDDISIRGFNDDVPGDAVRIFAGASAQTHNFHDAGDQDWTIFAIPNGGSNTISTTKLGSASAKLEAYRISPFPTETSPGRWDISLSDLILVDSDQSTGNNSVTVQNNTGAIQGYVIKAISSGPTGHNTDYQIISNN
jgi:subtilisin family serine protease